MANQCKYYKVVRQVSYDSGVTWVNIGETQKGDLYEYDSAECGAVTQYRWVDVTGAYTCEGTTKYQKTKKQYSTDGTTWQDVSPAEYGKGQVLEYDSVDCGGGGGDYRNQYLTFVAIDDAQFFYIQDGSNYTLSYSIDDGSTWSELQPRVNTPTVYAGQKIMWKGNMPSPTYEYAPSFNGNTNYRFNVEGNIMSLLYGDNFADKTTLYTSALHGTFAYCYKLISAEHLVLPATTLAEYCYEHMFYACNSLTTAPSTLPATTLAYRCYYMMFTNCTSLKTVPSLPATTLANGCYESMFKGCSSLGTVPADLLPATTLAESCYWCMFDGCKILWASPRLPAPTLVKGCYGYMFRGTNLLDYIICLATDISAENCTYDWFASNGAVRGQFYKAPGMSSWTRGTSGIPGTWTIYDYEQ